MSGLDEVEDGLQAGQERSQSGEQVGIGELNSAMSPVLGEGELLGGGVRRGGRGGGGGGDGGRAAGGRPEGGDVVGGDALKVGAACDQIAGAAQRMAEGGAAQAARRGLWGVLVGLGGLVGCWARATTRHDGGGTGAVKAAVKAAVTAVVGEGREVSDEAKEWGGFGASGLRFRLTKCKLCCTVYMSLAWNL